MKFVRPIMISDRHNDVELTLINFKINFHCPLMLMSLRFKRQNSAVLSFKTKTHQPQWEMEMDVGKKPFCWSTYNSVMFK